MVDLLLLQFLHEEKIYVMLMCYVALLCCPHASSNCLTYLFYILDGGLLLLQFLYRERIYVNDNLLCCFLGYSHVSWVFVIAGERFSAFFIAES